ncbi:MAG: biotin synthase BioB [Candidatus Makaraimicrobium thalassicum]|nr:MAG: biotin synthase BioB [Candidatus Omnitrophota bacterium]
MNVIEAEDILSMPMEELLVAAGRARREGVGRHIELCGIINAKSGACSEDCRFCAQSAHYRTNIPEYPLKSRDRIVAAARAAQKNGAERFGIVTSGRGLTRKEVTAVADAIREIRKETGILPCASLGALDADSFAVLKDAGLTRYHHNIETSERYYPFIVSTHGYMERIKTIERAKGAALEICSGGILGMGETWQDRVDMAFVLKKLGVDSVPLNFLIPIKGTPLENAGNISPLEALRVIALFRIILRDKAVKVIAGRESVLKGFQALMYTAGANGMMVGGYLTTSGRPPDEDRAMIEEIKKIWNEE